MRAGENAKFANFSANTAPFTLRGGEYGVDVIAMFGGGSVKLQRLADDGATYVSVGTDFTAAGYAPVYLAPGAYRFTVATATAAYANVQRIPGE